MFGYHNDVFFFRFVCAITLLATGVRGLLARFRGLSLMGDDVGAIVVFLFRMYDIVPGQSLDEGFQSYYEVGVVTPRGCSRKPG